MISEIFYPKMNLDSINYCLEGIYESCLTYSDWGILKTFLSLVSHGANDNFSLVIRVIILPPFVSHYLIFKCLFPESCPCVFRSQEGTCFQKYCVIKFKVSEVSLLDDHRYTFSWMLFHFYGIFTWGRYRTSNINSIKEFSSYLIIIPWTTKMIKSKHWSI